MKRYEHTQVGYLIIVATAAVMVLIGIVLANAGLNWTAIGVMVVIAVVLVLFSSLTVIIREDELEVRFGPGLIHRRFKLQDIESCQVVKNPWYYGWGIRITPRGWLYNVSGFYAVELNLRTGKRFRIGTDVPQELEAAIRQALTPGQAQDIREETMTGQDGKSLRKILIWLALFILVLIVSVIASVPVFALGLIVHEVVSKTLTLLVMGILAAISASWLSNLFRIGGKRSRQLHILFISEIAAVALAIVYFGVVVSPAAPALNSLFPINFLLLLTWDVLLSATACLAAYRYRDSVRELRRDALLSIIVLGCAIVVIVATIFVASLFGLTGA